MDFGLWMLCGAAAASAYSRFFRPAMGALGDALLGVGGGVAGGAMAAGFGLEGLFGGAIGGALGGLAMIVLIRALKD
jgi:hypothetical protein